MIYDSIIIGAGPSGLTAALYLARANKKILVLEALSFGGQIINTLKIDNYPSLPHISGYDFAEKLFNQVKEFDVEIKFEKVIDLEISDIKKVITTENTYQTKTIIIATGNSSKKLDIESDKYLGKGLSYCAACDGSFYKDKVVAVYGNSENALEDALYLNNIAKKVYLINPSNKKIDTEIEVLSNKKITSLNGDKVLESITLNNNEELKIDGLFVLLGRVPETEKFKNILNLDKFGYIIGDENCHTNISGVFVSGDARGKNLRQLVTATSDGAVSATEVIKYLSK